jgi:hypothetical protein
VSVVSGVTDGDRLKSGLGGYDTWRMGLDALLPPPLSRAHQKAQADEARQVRDQVDDFLSKLDAELSPTGHARSGKRPRRPLVD